MLQEHISERIFMKECNVFCHWFSGNRLPNMVQSVTPEPTFKNFEKMKRVIDYPKDVIDYML